MIQAEQLHARILEELDMTREIEDEELTELIYRVLQEASSEEYLSLSRKTELGKELFEKSILLPMKEDGLDHYREEYNEMLLSKITGTNNSIYQERYLTVSVHKRSIDDTVQISSTDCTRESENTMDS